MSIYQRKKAWYYDFQYQGERYTGSIGQVSKTVAKEELARRKAEVIEGRLNPAKARKSPAFPVFAAEYLEWCRDNQSPETIRRKTHTLTLAVKFFGRKRLREVTAWHLERFKRWLKEAGKAPGTVNTELAAVNALFAKAVEWKVLHEHPGKTVKMYPNPRTAERFLSEEEEMRLLNVCSPAQARLIEVGLLTGFRRKELASLRPADVNLDRRTVRVDAAYSKTKRSRTVPMGNRLRTLLQDALAGREEAPRVLADDKGDSWTVDRVGEMVRRLSKKAGLQPIGPHILRHTFASRLVMAGVDLRTVQELLGHQDIKMTLVYAHLSPDHKQAAIDLLEARYSGRGPANIHNTPVSAINQTS